MQLSGLTFLSWWHRIACYFKGVCTDYLRYYFSSSASEWLKLFKVKGVDARSSISHDMTKYFSGGFSAPNLVRNTLRLVSTSAGFSLAFIRGRYRACFELL